MEATSSPAATAENPIVALQSALNARGAPRGYPPLAVDGVLGPLTRQALQDLGHALGIEPEVLAAEQLAPEVAQLFIEPKGRSASQTASASERAPDLDARPIELDGVKLPWGLVKPLVRARAAGWSGRLEHAVRGVEVLGSLFEGKEAWWHRVLEVSDEGELLSVLGSMGYACELVAHSSGVVGASGLRFLEAPGPVEPGISGKAANAAPEAEAGDPTQAQPRPEATQTPAAETAAITGPDVSGEQGEIDWDQVAAAGHRFAFIRASSGVDGVDERFASNWHRAGAAGIRRGAYHLAEVAPAADPGDQAVNLVATVRAAGSWKAADLPPSVDVDPLAGALGGEEMADWVRVFSAVFARITHRPPAIRMTAQSFERMLGSNPSAIDSPVWLSGDPGGGQPQQPTPGLVWFEPLAGTQQCPGITGDCELSRFSGSPEQFDQLQFSTTSTK